MSKPQLSNPGVSAAARRYCQNSALLLMQIQAGSPGGTTMITYTVNEAALTPEQVMMTAHSHLERHANLAGRSAITGATV